MVKKIILFFILILAVSLIIIVWVYFLECNRPTSFVLNDVSASLKWVRNTLIKNNLCANEQDCTQKEYVFYEATKDTIYLNFYTIVDKNIIDIICLHFKNKKNNIVYHFMSFPMNHM